MGLLCHNTLLIEGGNISWHHLAQHSRPINTPRLLTGEGGGVSTFTLLVDQGAWANACIQSLVLIIGSTAISQKSFDVCGISPTGTCARGWFTCKDSEADVIDADTKVGRGSRPRVNLAARWCVADFNDVSQLQIGSIQLIVKERYVGKRRCAEILWIFSQRV